MSWRLFISHQLTIVYGWQQWGQYKSWATYKDETYLCTLYDDYLRCNPHSGGMSENVNVKFKCIYSSNIH